MIVYDREKFRRSLGRGVARNAFQQATKENANAARVFREVLGLKPNAQSKARFAKRLRRQKGVLSAKALSDGLTIDLRTVSDVTVRRDDEVFEEKRISWMRVRVVAARDQVSFAFLCVQASMHALQRRFERTGVALEGFLDRVDLSMQRVLGRLERKEMFHDRDDHYVGAQDGVWAGVPGQMEVDRSWASILNDASFDIPVFSVRTFLGEDEMRPTVWLRWSGSRGFSAAA